ncbi:hypothetical protein NQ318_003147 [Aromia moschata]|uniref:Uncharacterized protein n=1 Tax=Aromia moschata TaxID=1265417 RepID=A0AAV8YSG8_9CUCU|nr:hypothetical protein NQ318_003147 [Aromia moschata]
MDLMVTFISAPNLVHSYEKIDHSEIPEIFKKPYNRVETVEKATKGLEVTGILPFNRHIFADEDYVNVATPTENQITNVENESKENIASPTSEVCNQPSTSGIKENMTGKRQEITCSDSSDSVELVEVSDEEDFSKDKSVTLSASFSSICGNPQENKRVHQKHN